jgi:hypothetical protein
MKVIKFIVGTIVSIIAVTIAAKVAAFILGVLGFGLAVLLLLLKLAFLLAVVAIVFWALSRIFRQKDGPESV